MKQHSDLKINGLKIPHAYQEYEGTYLWQIVKDAVGVLERNEDLFIQTRRIYVIGFLCKSIAKGNEKWLLREKA